MVSERKRREGGSVDMHGGEEKGGGGSLPLVLPPYKPRSRTVSQQSQEQTESLFFPSGVERNWAWQRNDPAPDNIKLQPVELRLLSSREGERGGDSGKGRVSFTLGERAYQRRTETLEQEGEGVI